MPACVLAYDPGTHVNMATSPNYNDFNGHLLDPKKFAAALYSAQLQVRTQHQNQKQHRQQQQLITPPSSPKPCRPSPFDSVPYEILDQIIGLAPSDDAACLMT